MAYYISAGYVNLANPKKIVVRGKECLKVMKGDKLLWYKPGTYSRRIRYVRESANGNTVNRYNHWIEFNVIDKNGNYLLSNAVPTLSQSSGTPLGSVTMTNSTVITNGQLAAGNGATYAGFSGTTRESYAQITYDLGSVRTDIDKIKVWYFYSDLRRYRHYTEVSEDGINWHPIFLNDNNYGPPTSNSGFTYQC